jgi:hypothetical protein
VPTCQLVVAEIDVLQRRAITNSFRDAAGKRISSKDKELQPLKEKQRLG